MSVADECPTATAELDGLRVTLYRRDGESGPPRVQIETDELDMHPDGSPCLSVFLNDADLYRNDS